MKIIYHLFRHLTITNIIVGLLVAFIICIIKHTILGGIYAPISFEGSLGLAITALLIRLCSKGLIEDLVEYLDLKAKISGFFLILKDKIIGLLKKILFFKKVTFLFNRVNHSSNNNKMVIGQAQEHDQVRGPINDDKPLILNMVGDNGSSRYTLTTTPIEGKAIQSAPVTSSTTDCPENSEISSSNSEFERDPELAKIPIIPAGENECIDKQELLSDGEKHHEAKSAVHRRHYAEAM